MPKKNNPGCRCCQSCPETPRVLIAGYAASVGVAGIARPSFGELYVTHLAQQKPGCCIGGVDLVAGIVGPTHLPRPIEDYDLIYLAVPGGDTVGTSVPVGGVTGFPWPTLYPWIGEGAGVLRDWLDSGGKRLVLMADWTAWFREVAVLNEILAALDSEMRFEAVNYPVENGTDGGGANLCFYKWQYWRPGYTTDPLQPNLAHVLCPTAGGHPLMAGLDGLWAHGGVPVHGGTPLAVEPEDSDYSGGSPPCQGGCDCAGKVVAAIEETWGPDSDPSSVVAIGDMHVITDPYPYGFVNTAELNEAFIRRLWPAGCNADLKACRGCNLPPSVKVTVSGVGDLDPPLCGGDYCDGFNGKHTLPWDGSGSTCIYRALVQSDPDNPVYNCRTATVSASLQQGQFYGPEGESGGLYEWAWRAVLSTQDGSEVAYQYVSHERPCRGVFILSFVTAASNVTCDYGGGTVILEVPRA